MLFSALKRSCHRTAASLTSKSPLPYRTSAALHSYQVRGRFDYITRQQFPSVRMCHLHDKAEHKTKEEEPKAENEDEENDDSDSDFDHEAGTRMRKKFMLVTGIGNGTLAWILIFYLGDRCENERDSYMYWMHKAQELELELKEKTKPLG